MGRNKWLSIQIDSDRKFESTRSGPRFRDRGSGGEIFMNTVCFILKQQSLSIHQKFCPSAHLRVCPSSQGPLNQQVGLGLQFMQFCSICAVFHSIISTNSVSLTCSYFTWSKLIKPLMLSKFTRKYGKCSIMISIYSIFLTSTHFIWSELRKLPMLTKFARKKSKKEIFSFWQFMLYWSICAVFYSITNSIHSISRTRTRFTRSKVMKLTLLSKFEKCQEIFVFLQFTPFCCICAAFYRIMISFYSISVICTNFTWSKPMKLPIHTQK